HDFDDFFITRPRIRSQKTHLIHAIGQQIFHLTCQLVCGNFGVAQKAAPVPCHGHDHRVRLIGRLHGDGIPRTHHVHADALGQHRRDDHENDEHDEHHIHHGRHVNVGHRRRSIMFHYERHIKTPVPSRGTICPSASVRKPGRSRLHYWLNAKSPTFEPRRFSGCASKSSRSTRSSSCPSRRQTLRSCRRSS